MNNLFIYDYYILCYFMCYLKMSYFTYFSMGEKEEENISKKNGLYISLS